MYPVTIPCKGCPQLYVTMHFSPEFIYPLSYLQHVRYMHKCIMAGSVWMLRTNKLEIINTFCYACMASYIAMYIAIVASQLYSYVYCYSSQLVIQLCILLQQPASYIAMYIAIVASQLYSYVYCYSSQLAIQLCVLLQQPASYIAMYIAIVASQLYKLTFADICMGKAIATCVPIYMQDSLLR